MVNTRQSIGGKGFSNYYRKVALCRRCAALHDQWQRIRAYLWVFVVLAALLIALLVYLRRDSG
jgi:hypothetical protein